MNKVSGEELWQKPQVKVVMSEGVRLEEVIKISRTPAMLPSLSLQKLGTILCEKDEIWKVYAIKAEGDERIRLSMVGRIEIGKKWARRGDFDPIFEYCKTEAEIEVLDAEAITWKTIIVDHGVDERQKVQRYPGVLPRAAVARAATA